MFTSTDNHTYSVFFSMIKSLDFLYSFFMITTWNRFCRCYSVLQQLDKTLHSHSTYILQAVNKHTRFCCDNHKYYCMRFSLNASCCNSYSTTKPSVFLNYLLLLSHIQADLTLLPYIRAISQLHSMAYLYRLK